MQTHIFVHCTQTDTQTNTEIQTHIQTNTQTVVYSVGSYPRNIIAICRFTRTIYNVHCILYNIRTCNLQLRSTVLYIHFKEVLKSVRHLEDLRQDLGKQWAAAEEVFSAQINQKCV